MPLINLPEFANDLLSEFDARKAERIDTPVIQPAEPFLDIAGEDLRRRIFMTESETGASLCLRPEFTIPVCLRHIETATGTPKRYAYLGEVFRQRRDGANEFYQAGIEDLGDINIPSADARAIGDATGILARLLPGRRLSVTLGDQAVFEAVVQALGLPLGWQKRLIHAFGNMTQLEALLAGLVSPQFVTGLDDDIAKLVASGDEQALVAHLEQEMQATGYSTNAGRSPLEIARRLKEKLILSETRLDDAAFHVLEEFLSLDVPLVNASAALAGFADAAGLKLGNALSRFNGRVGALADAGVDLSCLDYRAAFGRPLDYYTGLVFEVTAEGSSAVLAGGGRYDRLLTFLGATDRIPAVGFSFWLDRIETERAAV
ncbi:ATP phosphoribosyltransferase regulatory subunit [Rhizobium redzepovicii]|uniref:ATP phosphoribosyltransferase regulatory subunit n=1 Tax=Rhizobium redzepovicii TaxID=2867518 RepID=A0AAW8NUD9_9HYPH|nr:MULTISPECIES: ATP phosphoribosyltransferase regulatory subunit [Rhizobium]MBB3521340.1 ATP phosphoribosyltransferase regulatory subunit [Rhizobium sp. BK456]MBY4591421.1 ATP phosphoribosyltransferase regulatory subunit [Rhizobium redzepovicii]MBY4615626.1 ATP phosphoribosyltransferase regulatory subunit [Rhizobium redzepovicii]MDF0658207.1 ATP phosphoribosyltransferase regulatory subunit [Rhizobium sp. BC49]MDR9758498.1 ATP phosphoribosyltransferase regulatory subunit [Rhizobium redzepovici